VKDRYGRELDSMRISVTTRCNLNCFYCHREGINSVVDELSAEDFEKIVKVSTFFGVRYIKLTGGEPLVRKDISDIISRLKGVDGIDEVSMTTNGVFLKTLAKKLKKNGLDRVNISLDTVKRERYIQITGKDFLSDVFSGIEAALRYGLTPVKINTVVMKGINDDELLQIIKLSENKDIIVQLIELEDIPGSRLFKKYHMSLDSIEKRLEEDSSKVITRVLHRRKVVITKKGYKVEFVKALHNSDFCMNCRRIRLTPDGKLKPCIMRNDNLVDLRGAINNEEKLKKLFKRAIMLREPFFKP